MPELLCPVCGRTLAGTEKTYICPSGHSFDRGKGGYVNLLISHQSGTQHGDDKAMVRARREFLDTGCYEQLQKALCSAVLRYAPAEETVDLLDAGCGECYYTAAVEQALLAAGKTPSIVGVDISKDALRFGGKRGRDLTLAVASAYHVPVKDASCDAVLNVFAPFAGEEYHRILKPGGVLLHVSPDEEHLWELKRAVYETPYRNDAAVPQQEGLTITAEEKIAYPLHLERHADIVNLFHMTPYAHKTSPADAARLDALEALDVAAAFVLRVYQKQ